METQKIVLVTGASHGIGKAVCLELSNFGYKVVGIARSHITDASFEYHVCDVSDENAVLELSKKIQPDIIICAAAINEPDNSPYNHDAVRKTMEINFFGTMNFVNAFVNAEHFISISSISAFKPNLQSVSYSASKAAIAMAFRGLAATNQKSSAQFSTIYLGPVNTAMWEGKKSWIVAEPEFIAQKIHKLILNPKAFIYTPFVSTALSRISLLIPDTLYTKISKFLFK
jgi:NAD(P)-dependent dehydrogenase (short-subunit alcohol dehydrogenase family)